MTAIGLLLVLLLLSAGVGRSLLRQAGAMPESPGDRLLFSAALGLGLISYLMLFLGLLPFRLLAPVPMLIGLALLAALSRRGFAETARDLGSSGTQSPNDPTTQRPLHLITALALAAFGLLVLLNCFVPPAAHEWDALSYHLAVPKIWLAQRHIVFLPTLHQSNFSFLVEMLFTLGLMLNGYALANLIHFALGALCAAAIWSLGRRFAPGAGQIGALVFATTPVVLWEAGIAYIEMGMTLYCTLAVAAALAFRETREPRWLALCGILMGFALSIKALALIPFVLIAVLLLVERARFRNLRWYLLGAIVVGCPYYVKSAVLTGNPVYPFFYSIFGGKYWSRELAEPYAKEQAGYGQNHHKLLSVEDDMRLMLPPDDPPDPLDRVRNLLLAPFSLVAIPRFFYNPNDFGPFSQAGFLFLALPPLLLLAGEASSAAKWCAALAALWFTAWSQTMQYVRYLIPFLPLLGLLGGEGAVRMARRYRLLGCLIGAAIFMQAALTLSAFAPRVPDQWARATDPQAREEYLTRSVNVYAAEKWINANAPPAAGVILFEETRGFYLDRPYLWGNSGHSLYIPYSSFADGREMADWFLQEGYRYAILNLQFSPLIHSAQEIRDAVASGSEAEITLRLYNSQLRSGERWRRLLGEAFDDGAAVILPEASSRAAIVIEFRPSMGKGRGSHGFGRVARFGRRASAVFRPCSQAQRPTRAVEGAGGREGVEKAEEQGRVARRPIENPKSKIQNSSGGRA